MQAHLITIDGTHESFRCRDDMHVLDAMERAACCAIPVGCRNGGCGACKVRVLSGRYARRKMSRAVVSVEEEAQGYTLACKTYPQSDLQLRPVHAMASARRKPPPGKASDEFVDMVCVSPNEET